MSASMDTKEPSIKFIMIFECLVEQCPEFTVKFDKTLSNTLWKVFWELKSRHPTIIENYYEVLANTIQLDFDNIIEELNAKQQYTLRTMYKLELVTPHQSN